jgi:hypothetical protein
MKTDLGEPYKFVVPWEMQEWTFNSLSHQMCHEIANYLMSVYEQEILNQAQARHADGYTHYGSEMYTWTPEERFENVMQELADAVVYMTSGPLPKKENDVV